MQYEYVISLSIFNLRRTQSLSLNTHFEFFEGPIVSYGDENGNCKCPDGHNILELEDIELELTSARSERRRQRAFLKKHTTMGIDTFENDKTRTYHDQHMDYMNDSRSNFHGTAHTDRAARIKRQSEPSPKNVEAISGDQLHQNPEVSISIHIKGMPFQKLFSDMINYIL